MAIYACNPNTKTVETGGIQDLGPLLCSDFKDSLGYTLYLNKQINK